MGRLNRGAEGRGALLSSFYTLSEKVAVALGAFAVAGILSLGGFVESRGTPVVQTPEALAAIRYAFVIPCVLAQLATAVLALMLHRALENGSLQRTAPLSPGLDP